MGVVFGDIGTSPLYTIQTVFNPDDPHPVTAATESIFGIVSLAAPFDYRGAACFGFAPSGQD